MTADKALQREISELADLPISELRTRWEALFQKSAPPAFGPDLLRRSIAFKVQENFFGRMSVEHRRKLNQLVKKLRENPDEVLKLSRRIKTGAELVRTWKGICHRAVVGEQGYLYAGETYKTLSEIARKITGTRWNGPRFFGLRDPKTYGTPTQKVRRNR